MKDVFATNIEKTLLLKGYEFVMARHKFFFLSFSLWPLNSVHITLELST